METKFRGLPYRPWKISCITKSCVTNSRRHNQIIVRNCTIVMVAVVRQVYLKIFRFKGGRILIASYYHVTTFYKSSHVVCRYGITTFKISYPRVFKELLGRNKLCDSLTLDVNLFALLYACEDACERWCLSQRSFPSTSPSLSERDVKVRYSDRDLSL